MTMTGADIQALRQRKNLTTTEFGELLGNALGRSRPWSQAAVTHWENDTRRPSKHVIAFLEEMEMATALETDGQPPFPGTPTEPEDLGPPDSAPGPGPTEPQPVVLSGKNAWTRACEDLWEMIATGVGMIGAAVSNQALMMDGAIIAADKEALGAAWGRLAETNETFRRILLQATEGGVWLQVALATGTTVSKCWQSHITIAEAERQAAEANGGYPADEPSPAAAA